jgi:hypothetical protein
MRKQPITRDEVERARQEQQQSAPASLSPELAQAAQKVGSGLKGFAKRFMVHAAGLLFFAPTISALTTDAVDEGAAILLAYLAFICLLPRGPVNDRTWYVPAAAGLVQWALAGLLGMPLATAAFLGGLQAYALRAILKKLKMGSEWVTAFFLLAGVTALFTTTASTGLSWAAILSMIPVAGAGWLVDRALARLTEAKSKEKLVAEILDRFKDLAQRKQLGSSILAELDILSSRASQFFTIINKGGHTDDAILNRINTLTREMFAAKTDMTASERLLHSMQDLSDELDRILQERGGPSSGIIDEFRGYEQQVRELLIAKRSLTAEPAKHIDAIAYASYGIIKQMREDPTDKPAGERFLKRYLKATAEVVSERRRLEQSSSSNRSQALSSALSRSDEVLEHMAQAFRDEEQYLMNNDTVNFTAQLNALETFMKMRGH